MILPSWRPGPTRDAIVSFLDASNEVPVPDRVACFDVDGTLWCERPNYLQFEFFADALAARVRQDPDLGSRPELAAVLAHDAAAIDALGLERTAIALLGLFDGVAPDDFAGHVRAFLASAMHPTLLRPSRTTVYQPMRELLTELRGRQFAVALVTGGGTEFVRAISTDLYDVPPELVVGTMISYGFARAADGTPHLARTSRIEGAPNEGASKVTNIQTQLGRRPILAAGNSGGDREMLEWAAAGAGPTLALLVDHDDAEREFSYVSIPGTFTEDEPILSVGRRLGWTVASMADDWSTVFPGSSRPPEGDGTIRTETTNGT